VEKTGRKAEINERQVREFRSKASFSQFVTVHKPFDAETDFQV